MSQQQDQSTNLKNQFIKAEALVNEGKVQVPETIKYKLYGLGKQVVVGDCKMPQPPA
jgi:acyl-CoA-binding protein